MILLHPLNKTLLGLMPEKALNDLKAGAKMDEDSLNCALLSNNPEEIVSKLIELGAKTNGESLNCAWLSTCPDKMVAMMKKLGATSNDDTKKCTNLSKVSYKSVLTASALNHTCVNSKENKSMSTSREAIIRDMSRRYCCRRQEILMSARILGEGSRTNSSFIASRKCFFNEIPESVLIEITEYIGYKKNEDELKELAIASLKKPSVSQTFPRSP